MDFVTHQLVAQLVKNLPAMWETGVRSLGWEHPLEKRKASHSSILAWRIPWTVVHGVAKSRTWLSNLQGFPESSVGKESACNAGDPGLFPGLGRSAGEGIDYLLHYSWASLVAQPVKNLPAMGGDLDSISGLGKSPGERKGYPLQYSGLENFMDWIVHGVTKSRTLLSNFHFHFSNQLNSCCYCC